MTSIDRYFNQTLTVRRASPASPSSVDEWNIPALAADVTVLTLPGRIRQLGDREVTLLTDAGVQVGDFRAYTRPADIRDSDRIVDADGVQYEIRSRVMPGGVADHLELLLRKVAP